MKSKDRRKELGQTLVEFTLTLPILLTFTFGILDFGRILFTYAQASNSLRQAVRRAPVLGSDPSNPTFLNCTLIQDTAEEVYLTDVTVTIEYALSTDPGTTYSCGGTMPTIGDIRNGDLMQVTSNVQLTPIVTALFLPDFTINIDFEGQRTILTYLTFGSGLNDRDSDGLDDTWETGYFGNITSWTGLDDPDGDGRSNGQEESEGTNPTVASCSGSEPDELDDLWEAANYASGNPADYDECDNPDGDAYTNALELANGTDPESPDP